MSVVESLFTLNPFGKEDECAKMIIDSSLREFILSNITIAGQQYTLSFWVKSDDPGTLTAANHSIQTTDTWQRFVHTFVANKEYVTFNFSDAGTYYIYHSQLELGNKATDWSPDPEDMEVDVDEFKTTVETSYATRSELSKTAEGIRQTVSGTYSTKGELEEYKETVASQFSQVPGQISAEFTKTEERITEVDGVLTSKLNKIYKHIKLSDQGITIGSSGSSVTLRLDNESGIEFWKTADLNDDGIPKDGREAFGRWDGDNFYTGNIVVRTTERAQFGDFAFVPRSDGSLMFLKVGG